MPTPVLTRIDLSDPSPPVPGERERGAVHARATQLTRRRRIVLGGALGVALVVGSAAVAIAAGGSGTGTDQVAILQVRSTTQEPGSTVTVELRNDDATFAGQADANDTVHFDTDIAPGTYRVFVTVESPPGTAPEGVGIGTAIATYRSITMTLEPGVNVLDLDTLTPATPPTT